MVSMNAPVPQTLDAKSRLTMAHVRENEQKLNDNKIHIRKTLKNNPSLTKEIRTVLEQSLVEKLETLGINAVSSLTLGIFTGLVLFCFLNNK